MMSIDDPVSPTGEGEAARPASEDRLRRVIHAMLAIYLLPAMALVLVVGGGLMAVGLAARGAVGLAGVVSTGFRPGVARVESAERRTWVRGPLAAPGGRSSRRARADIAERRRA